MGTQMAIETGGGFAGYKILAAVVAIASPLFAFFLGLQVIPLDKTDPHADTIRRLMGCATSSMVLGGPALIVLNRMAPWVFESAVSVGAMLHLPELGLLWLIAVVLLISALPGWWLVGAVMRRLATWRDKDLGQIISDAKTLADEVKP